LTVDESFNVAQGVDQVDRLFALDLTGFRQVDARLPDHPPLGRLWIGICHELAFLISPPIDNAVSITCARAGPALAFAVTVFLVGWYTTRWSGRWAGALAAVSLVLMPRTFGHAHIASLETCINLAYTAAVLYLADRWVVESREDRQGASAPAYRTAVIGGVLFGLALLTKIQAILLPVPVAIWSLVVLRRRGLALVAIWGLAGALVLLVGWPYLWSNTVAHVQRYLGRTTQRSEIFVWYGGRSIADHDVPWHYPWVLFGTTIPIALLALGASGFIRSLMCSAPPTNAPVHPQTSAELASSRPPVNANARRAALLLACLVFPLVVFSIPGVAVYDGERLFSISYPLWGVFVGAGADWARRSLSTLGARLTDVAIIVVFATQACGSVLMAPCWLSYYNLLIGSVHGAQYRGLPVTYWGDGVTRTLLAEIPHQVPPDSTIAVAPVLHKGQWDVLLQQSPALRKHGIQFAALGSPEAADAEYLLFFPRWEYLPPAFRQSFDPYSLVAKVERHDVLLGGLYRLR
jgi:hypothetical protein